MELVKTLVKFYDETSVSLATLFCGEGIDGNVHFPLTPADLGTRSLGFFQ
jgi:hypothetical protein